VSYRFRAATTGNLTDVIYYHVGSSGYGAGTGGAWRAQVFADDGTSVHHPTGSALATQALAASVTNTAGRSFTFSSPASLVTGTLYHLVFENVDASPTANYASVDLWATFHSVSQPGYSAVTTDDSPQPVDLGYLQYTGGAWNSTHASDRVLLPIVGLTIGGVLQGQSYGEASYNDASDVATISGSTHMVREKFTPSSTVTVTGAGFRTWKLTGGTGDLTIGLYATSGDTLIDSFTVPTASITSGSAPTTAANAVLSGHDQADWVTGSFSSSRTLTSGTSYYLRMSAPSGTTCYACVQRRLYPNYDYGAPSCFTDGTAESTTDGSTWAGYGNVPTRNDLSFYLVTAS